MDFMRELNTEINNMKTLTENGAIAYATSGKNLLDFNFKITDLRNSSEEQIAKDFAKVFFEDRLIAMKYLFYLGDVREGLGERHIFKSCINWLCAKHPEYARKVLCLIPEYSRWDNLAFLIDNKNVSEEVVNIIARQLTEDIRNMSDGKPISLCAKWMPSENTSCIQTRKLANTFIKKLNLTPRKYRKTLSSLRSYLKIVESTMSSNNWSEIDYESVPSMANIKYSNAFLRHDEERRRKYLNELKSGNVKINASVAQPHDIVSKYTTGWVVKSHIDETLEAMWKSLKDITTKNTLVVRDGSGSMTCSISNSKATALHVATALAIYCSEHTTGGFKDKFITFSANPEFVDMSNCSTLHDKLELCYTYDDCSNTNIEKTMELILNTAISNNMSQEDLPDTILIISDMQFDLRRSSFHWNESLFDSISRDFISAGYKMPKICFWNLCGRNAQTIPMQKNELGLILCSGFSINNLKMFMSGDIDPYKILLDIINSERYNKVEELLNKPIRSI